MKPGPIGFGDFKSAYCMRFACAPKAYDHKLFWNCLHQRAIILASLVYLFYPRFFERDFHLIRKLARTRRLSEFQQTLQEFTRNNRETSGFMRRSLRVRLSGQRLMKVGMELLK